MDFITELNNKKEQVITLMRQEELTKEELKTVYLLQGERGNFEIHTEPMPSDAYINFIHHTSAYVTGRLMVELVKGNLKDEGITILHYALDYFSVYLDAGHGYEHYGDLCATLKVFIEFDVMDFINTQTKFSPEFTKKFYHVIRHIREGLNNKTMNNTWGTSYAREFKKLLLQIDKGLI